MTLTRWQQPRNWTLTPFRRATSFRDEVDQLLEYAFGELREGRGPAINLYDNKEVLTVEAELPGMKKDDIQINLQDGFLTISGERKQEEKREGAESYRSERVLGRFHRAISLPTEVDAEKIKASYADGILTVTLPKSEKAKPRQIPISVE